MCELGNFVRRWPMRKTAETCKSFLLPCSDECPQSIQSLVRVNVSGSGSGVGGEGLPEDDEEEAMEALDEDVEAAPPPPAYGYHRPQQFEGSTLTPSNVDKRIKVKKFS